MVRLRISRRTAAALHVVMWLLWLSTQLWYAISKDWGSAAPVGMVAVVGPVGMAIGAIGAVLFASLAYLRAFTLRASWGPVGAIAALLGLMVPYAIVVITGRTGVEAE